MRKHTPRRLLAYGLSVVAVAALAIAGAASADHWDDYNGTADTHEVVDGNPPLCPAAAGGLSLSLDGSELSEGGVYPSGDPVVKVTALDKDGGTLSWALLPDAAHTYDMAAVVMKGGEPGSGRVPLRRERFRDPTTPMRGSRRRSTRAASRPASATSTSASTRRPTRVSTVSTSRRPRTRRGRRSTRGTSRSPSIPRTSAQDRHDGDGQLEGRRHTDRLRCAERGGVRDDHRDEPQ